MSSFENLSTDSATHRSTTESDELVSPRWPRASDCYPKPRLNFTHAALGAFVRCAITHLTSVAILSLFTPGSHAECVFAAIIRIQSLIRGFIARRRSARFMSMVEFDCESRSRQYHAVVIQRHVRGFLSRRIHNLIRRRRTLSILTSTNDATRCYLRNLAQVNRESQQSLNTEHSRDRLMARANSQHHLLSTQSLSGVFNAILGGPISADGGLSMETVIKDCYRASNTRK